MAAPQQRGGAAVPYGQKRALSLSPSYFARISIKIDAFRRKGTSHGQASGELKHGHCQKTGKGRRRYLRGFLEETTEGKQIALDRNYRRKGCYDPARGITMDLNGKTIAHGNVLAELILGHFNSFL